MKNLSRIKNSMALHTFIAFVLLFSGCVSVDLKKAALDIKTYSLELSAPHQDSFAGAPVMLRVNDFSAVPFFNDRYLAYRSGETTYEQDFYNQLVAAPAKLIQDEVAVWLRGSPVVASVVTPSLISAADYVIDARVIELSGDYRIESEPKAVLKIQFTVSADTAVLCQKIYTAEIPVERISPVTLTEGWNKGLSQIMTGFETDLASTLATANKE